MSKKVYIVGPIGDFGGREVEVNIIAKALEYRCEVTILSTLYMTEKSFALQNLAKTKWKSIFKIIFQSNLFIVFFSLSSRIFNKGNLKAYAYINNSLTKLFFSKDKLLWKSIEKEIEKADCLILCVQLTTKFLPEIVNFCFEKNIPCYIRTTGTIRKLDKMNFDFLKKVTLFIHHSESNALSLNKQISLPYTIVDQCALNEKELLLINKSAKKPIRYGYLGRLSEEKGILHLTNYFRNLNYPFIIAGDGPQKNEILSLIKENTLCQYVGLIDVNEIAAFFKKIDVLIIPSFEESGPLVGLEAMAAGKLIISTNVGAMSDRLSNLKSFWFDIENVSSLQECINEIEDLSIREFEDFSDANRIKYKNEYSFNAIVLKYLAIIQ